MFYISNKKVIIILDLKGPCHEIVYPSFLLKRLSTWDPHKPAKTISQTFCLSEDI